MNCLRTIRNRLVAFRLDARSSACLVVVALSLVWLFLVAFSPVSLAQRSCLVYRGEAPLLDWNFLRKPAELAHPYAGAGEIEVFPGSGPIDRADLCNPPLALLLVRLLPEGRLAGWGFSAFGLFAYLLAAGYFLKRRTGEARGLDLIALALSLPVMFAAHVGNSVLLSAAASMVFLADCDSDSRARRRLAALLLAFAFAIKISPALLGVVYFGRGFRERLPDAVLAALAGLVLLIVPFAFYGGIASFEPWLANAAANSAKYAFRNPIGLCGVWYALGRDASLVQPCAAALAFACLVVQSFRRGLDKLALAVAGMLMLPPTMMIYTLVYLLPIVLARCPPAGSPESPSAPSFLTILSLVFLACPLQLFIGSFALQPLFSALGTLLVLASGWRLKKQCFKNQMGRRMHDAWQGHDRPKHAPESRPRHRSRH